MLTRRGAGVALVAIALILGACGGDDDGGGDGGGGSETLDVTARDFEFAETSLSVPAGEEVEVQFTNEGEAEHSFTVEDLEVEVEADGGESATTTFTADAGTYEFHCEYHPDQMTGELTVE
ncbi:MAG TPA: cupredoxin domain-containing protein [Actinomycetota bacterium]|nr:cupredoxin domain-containing protein [Actinomycetota bacterium]